MATYVLPNGVQAVVYVDINHHVDQIFYQNNQWQFNDLTAFTNSLTATPGSPLATYVLPNGVQAIGYIDVNQHVDQLFYQQNTWQFNDLTAMVSGPSAALGSALATYVLPNGVQALAYISGSQHINQIFYQESRWQLNDLTAATSAPGAVAQSSLAAYVLPNSVQAIAYLDQIQHVDQLFYQTSVWQFNDLTTLAHAPPAATESALVTYVLPNGVQAIAFLDQTNHVDQVFYQQSQWLFNDLTAFASAPVAAAGSALASYVLPNGVQAIVYLDNNANVDQLFYQQGQWNFNDLTPFTNAPAAITGSSLATYVLPNGVQAIAFIDSNHHVDQLFFQGGTWQYNDLSSFANAPAAFTGGSLNPSAPGKEYIYFGGKVIAVENAPQ